MKIVDYHIRVQEIIPPMGGGLTHAARIDFVVIRSPDGNIRDNPNLGEVHGRSEDEARMKMKRKFDEWAEKQQ